MADKIILPVTPDGNDFADYDEDTLDKLNADIDRQHERTRVSRGLSPSRGELDRMAAFLELCTEYQARTGNDLDPHAVQQKAEYTEALRLAGRL